jgi:hypothetical protein
MTDGFGEACLTILQDGQQALIHVDVIGKIDKLA